MRVLRYGSNAVLQLEPPTETVVADLSAPQGRPMAYPAAAVVAALG